MIVYTDVHLLITTMIVDVRQIEMQPSTLADLIVHELIYYAFIHAQPSASLWIIRNESFFEVFMLLFCFFCFFVVVLCNTTQFNS
jgi:hypothetical protein